MHSVFRYLRRNPSLTIGIALLAVLAMFVIIGHLLVDTEDARPLSVPALRPPSGDYPFGTDRQGRDLLAVMVAGTPLTLRIGFVAGLLGVGLGTVLAFIGAYYRGLLDTIIRGVADIGLTVPGLLVPASVFEADAPAIVPPVAMITTFGLPAADATVAVATSRATRPAPRIVFTKRLLTCNRRG